MDVPGGELLVSPPGFLILPVFGLGCVKVHHAAVQRFPGTLVGPWTLQELPLQNLLKLDQIQVPQCLRPLRILH